jgi:hypothetical protein
MEEQCNENNPPMSISTVSCIGASQPIPRPTFTASHFDGAVRHGWTAEECVLYLSDTGAPEKQWDDRRSRPCYLEKRSRAASPRRRPKPRPVSD